MNNYHILIFDKQNIRIPYNANQRLTNYIITIQEYDQKKYASIRINHKFYFSTTFFNSSLKDPGGPTKPTKKQTGTDAIKNTNREKMKNIL